MTNRIMRIIRPKTLKFTHCDSVNWPEKATYRLMAPHTTKKPAQLRFRRFQAASGMSICPPISFCMRLRPKNHWLPSRAEPKIQYNTVGFHLMRSEEHT